MALPLFLMIDIDLFSNPCLPGWLRPTLRILRDKLTTNATEIDLYIYVISSLLLAVILTKNNCGCTPEGGGRVSRQSSGVGVCVWVCV